MIESWVTHEDIIKELPKLDYYIGENQIDFNEMIGKAKERLNDWAINQGLNPRLLCTRLSLTDGTISGKDTARRTRLVIDITSITDEVYFTFTGQDSTTGSSVTIDTILVAEKGRHTIAFSDMYKYYTLTVTGTCTYTAYLVERSFELPHLYLSIHMIFKNLTELQGDKYQAEAEEYEMRYKEAIQQAQYSYDEDDDNDIESDETFRFNDTEIML